MFEPIIQYYIDRGLLHERGAYDARKFVAYLEEQTEYTKARLEEVIQRFNYDTVVLYGEEKISPHLTFWRGMDDYHSVVGVDYDGGVDIKNDLEPIVKPQINYNTLLEPPYEDRIADKRNRNEVKIDINKYPISILNSMDYNLSQTALFYAWIANLWQEVEGYSCGLKVMTVQNNSIARFSLNDFLNDDFSAYMETDYGSKPPRLGRFFNRKLSIVELYLRASQWGYPFNPYKNYWRYFERGDEFKEIVTYECCTGIRSGKLDEGLSAKLKQVQQHENPKTALGYITHFTNQAINNGWEEKFRPKGLPEQMHEQAYDFGFWTGIAWFSPNEKDNRLQTESLRGFEERYKVKLPDAFFQYLRLFNGRQYNNYHLNFPINDLYTVKVEKFYNVNELDEMASATLSQTPHYLWIGTLVEEAYLGICIKPDSEQFGKVVIGKKGNIQICDYSFQKFARYAQARPVQPEIFAAEENDIAFLKKRLEEGWDFNTKYNYQNALSQAADHNAHDTLELLLQHGARLQHKSHREMPWLYDEKTMDLLDKYS